ncbi:enolase C-terminal domain-like protein [Martelella mediterranea]|uniref:O-succinylbenzoate synthase n=1 Tax=Martelella mediterranea DSM 17316 TaxID=1122214 RepID=A0A1U9Z462_9HYPH|nr:enolase C-terminal domain-like protein [Martelella mediterranea]AQZ52468.1 o-succinylbenzoate synthase [Martelella mediterranea DSM 17316]
MSAARISLKAIAFRTRPVRFRLPFHFGNTVVTETDQGFVSVTVEVDGQIAEGHAAQLMVPRWFDKRASRTNEDTVADLKRSLEFACRSAEDIASETIAAATTRMRHAVEAAMPEGTPRLAAHFGPALVEMALIDAVCRAHGLNFPQAAKADLFGVSTLAAPDISSAAITGALAGITPLPAISPRQTVGFDAPIFSGEADRADDGLPVSLEAIIRATGIRAFKIKLKGEPDADIDRLAHIATLVDQTDNYRVTLDANEQYLPDRFAAFLDRLQGDPRLSRLRNSIAFIEQPFARETALTLEITPALSAFPLIIDESDDHDDAFATAIAYGWSGTSIKSCKGVLRALLNYARKVDGRAHGKRLFISAEDLTCQPGLCWQQDTLVAATLGCRDVERNGHHFGGGLQGYDDLEKARLLAAHPDLYRRNDGRIDLRIEDGTVAIGSLFGPGFGR